MQNPFFWKINTIEFALLWLWPFGWIPEPLNPPVQYQMMTFVLTKETREYTAIHTAASLPLKMTIQKSLQGSYSSPQLTYMAWYT